MAIINELTIGTVPELNGMTMYRKYDGENGFKPYFKFIDDNTLSLDSNIVVHYVEYFKNSNNVIIKELTKYKTYVVGNRAKVLWNAGDVITPAVMNGEVEVTPAVIANGTEIKVTEWLGANRWFLSVARTPIYAPYGIMDGIEATLMGLPMNIPNGYVLQSPL